MSSSAARPRRARVLLALVLALGAACSPSRPTNVLLISIDTLRADRLGCYGYARPTSPTLDALARGGTLFEHTVAQSPWTVPSHATLFTGLFPHGHGVVSESDRLAEELPTLATLLRGRGFLTAAVVQTSWLSAAQGFTQGFDSFVEIPDYADGGTLVARAAETWLRAYAGRPLFLFLHFYDVHSEYRPKPEYRERFTKPYDGFVDGSTMQLQELRNGFLALGARDLEQLSDLYDAEIRQLDDALGRLLPLLDELGVRDETLVVVTADHGEEFLEHGNVLHGRTLYREVLAVPLIWNGPGVPRGARVAAIASLADVVPTVLGRLGAAVPAGLDGIDLLAAPGPSAERRVVAAADHYNAEPDSLRMIQDLRYKLIVERITGAVHLYDLERDPAERTDVAAQSPERVATLRQQLERHLARARQAPARAPLSPEQAERLRALGYLVP